MNRDVKVIIDGVTHKGVPMSEDEPFSCYNCSLYDLCMEYSSSHMICADLCGSATYKFIKEEDEQRDSK